MSFGSVEPAQKIALAKVLTASYSYTPAGPGRRPNRSLYV